MREATALAQMSSSLLVLITSGVCYMNVTTSQWEITFYSTNNYLVTLLNGNYFVRYTLFFMLIDFLKRFCLLYVRPCSIKYCRPVCLFIWYVY